MVPLVGVVARRHAAHDPSQWPEWLAAIKESALVVSQPLTARSSSAAPFCLKMRCVTRTIVQGVAEKCFPSYGAVGGDESCDAVISSGHAGCTISGIDLARVYIECLGNCITQQESEGVPSCPPFNLPRVRKVVRRKRHPYQEHVCNPPAEKCNFLGLSLGLQGSMKISGYS